MEEVEQFDDISIEELAEGTYWNEMVFFVGDLID